MTTLLLLVVVGLLLAQVGAGAGEKELKELKQQREALREQRAAQAASVDAARAEFEEVVAALDALNADVAAAEERLAAAQKAKDDADAALESVKAQEEFVLSEMDSTRDEISQLAVKWYVDGRDSTRQSELLSTSDVDPNQSAVRQALFEVRVGRETQLVDQLRQLGDDLDLLALERDQAVADAADTENRLAQSLTEVEAARNRQQEFADEVESRLDARLAEANSLAELDAELAAKIRAEEAEIARKLAEARRREELARRRAAVPTIVGAGDIVTVSGIRVHKSIANNVANLLAAAARDGIFLSGGGYRNSSSQIALRRAHCGTSDYDIYQKPSYRCRPPTARPGHSMHERGLAIDFTANGRAITSRSSAAYKWLKANAGKYGLINLPSEPWHWSTTGQ